MQEIIKISQTVIGNDELNSVNSRDLHKSLEIRQDFSSWIKKQIKALGLEENVDYISLTQKVERQNGASKKIDYIITLDAAKHISMASRTAKGKEVRQYFIQTEKKLNEIGTVQNLTPVINTMLDMMSVQTKLLEKLLDNQEQQIKTISKEESKKIRSNFYILSGIILECEPFRNESQTISRLYRELNSRLGVSTYHDISSDDYEEAIDIQKKQLKNGRGN
jgi:phage anti-repressor protein